MPLLRPLHRYAPVPPVAVDDHGYPYEDAAPFMEGSGHTDALRYAGSVCDDRYAGRACTAVAMALHYRKGDCGAFIVPDLFVSLGAPDRGRLSYKLWEEPTPDFVLEVLSAKTWTMDMGPKKDTCEALGIGEYWLFDPFVKRLDAPVAGYRLQDGAYRPVPTNAAGRFVSEALGLELWGGDQRLRLYDLKTGEYRRISGGSPRGSEGMRGRESGPAGRRDAPRRSGSGIAADARGRRGTVSR